MRKTTYYIIGWVAFIIVALFAVNFILYKPVAKKNTWGSTLIEGQTTVLKLGSEPIKTVVCEFLVESDTAHVDIHAGVEPDQQCISFPLGLKPYLHAKVKDGVLRVEISEDMKKAISTRWIMMFEPVVINLAKAPADISSYTDFTLNLCHFDTDSLRLSIMNDVKIHDSRIGKLRLDQNLCQPLRYQDNPSLSVYKIGAHVSLLNSFVDRMYATNLTYWLSLNMEEEKSYINTLAWSSTDDYELVLKECRIGRLECESDDEQKIIFDRSEFDAIIR